MSSQSVSSAIGHVGFARHDWGTQLAYEAARERPDVFTAVIGITIPVKFSLPLSNARLDAEKRRKYIPAAGPHVPTEHQVKAHPRLAYQLFFDEQTPTAIDELNRDVRRTLRGTLRDVATPPPDSFLTSRDTYVGAWDGVDEVAFFLALLGLGPCVKPFLRSPQSHSSRKRRRITGLNNTAKAALITVSFHASRECGKNEFFFVAALQFYTAEVRVIAFGLIPFLIQF
jgi:pimeloyl-ACP methyl ester carboxylesterase